MKKDNKLYNNSDLKNLTIDLLFSVKKLNKKHEQTCCIHFDLSFYLVHTVSISTFSKYFKHEQAPIPQTAIKS